MGRQDDWDRGQLQNLISDMLLDKAAGLMSEPYKADMLKAGIQIHPCKGIRDKLLQQKN